MKNYIHHARGSNWKEQVNFGSAYNSIYDFLKSLLKNYLLKNVKLNDIVDIQDLKLLHYL